MSSTFPSDLQHRTYSEDESSTLAWRCWPLADHARWSWTVAVGVLLIGAAVSYASASVLLGVLAVAAISITLWQFFVLVWYEISPLGLRRRVFGRSRLLPWHAVRSYQLRASGVVLHRRAQPAPIEVLRSTFMPYPADPDEALLALRNFLPHAVELPTSPSHSGS